MKPKVSVIVPAYNAEKSLERCLDSLLQQSYGNVEIIVVDDGSIDHTGKIGEEYAKQYSCIKIMHQNNSGVSVARNRALSIATGEYITFTDSDDEVSPDYIVDLMRYADFDFVTAGYYWQSSDYRWHKQKFEDNSIKTERLRKYPSKFLGKYYFGSLWGTLMHKNIIDRYDLKFDARIRSGEDTLFIFQYLKHSEIIKIMPLCGYYYYYYPQSLVRQKNKNYWKWKIQVEQEILDFYRPVNQSEENYLLNRSFTILKYLLQDYSRFSTNTELSEIYHAPYFSLGIQYTKENGTFRDRLLIFCMNFENYNIFSKMDSNICKLESIIGRLKNRVNRKRDKVD